ncbi:MAG: putative ABC transporter permease [Enterococcaceae bacterium]|nr:putative ABC transporter permease [Enterococcaceae bacterium]MCI1918541.1 putative ABC transporter permease [Enterococcaceae bacterium]
MAIQVFIILFFAYSVIGWLWETIYCSLKAHHYVYRGFLVGPYCPIYAFGIMGVVMATKDVQANIFLLFVVSAAFCTILEYVTSWALEKLFHATWWDYKDVPFNINGRIALPVSLGWGIGCTWVVRWLHPRVLEIAEKVADNWGWVAWVIALVMITDTCYTLVNMLAFRRAVSQVGALLKEKRDSLQENVEMGAARLKADVGASVEDFVAKRKENSERYRLAVAEIKEHPEKFFPKLPHTPTMRRFLRNFPALKFPEYPDIFSLKAILETAIARRRHTQQKKGNQQNDQKRNKE